MKRLFLLFLFTLVAAVPVLAETAQPAKDNTAAPAPGGMSMPGMQTGQYPTQSQPTWPMPMQGQWGQYPQTAGMGGMGCGGMNMGAMGGMGCGGMGMGGMNMGGMGMQTSAQQMGHYMDQGLTMRDTLFILSMQDALQLVMDMARIQEKMMESASAREKEKLRKEIEQLRDRTKKVMQDYRGYMAGQISNQ